MPFSFSNFTQSGVFNHIFRDGSMSKPSTLALGLCSIVPTDTSTGASCNELANAGSYARIVHQSGDATWSHGSPGSGINRNTISFPVATADWGMVSGLAVFDSATYGGGNLIAFGQLVTPRDIRNTDQMTFASSRVSILVD